MCRPRRRSTSYCLRVRAARHARRTVAIVDQLTLGEVDEGGGNLRGRFEDAEQTIAEVDSLAQVELVVPREVVGRQQPAEDCAVSSTRRAVTHLGS